MPDDRKKEQTATPDEPPQATKHVDGPKATEPQQKPADMGAAGEGVGPHDD